MIQIFKIMFLKYLLTQSIITSLKIGRNDRGLLQYNITLIEGAYKPFQNVIMKCKEKNLKKVFY